MELIVTLFSAVIAGLASVASPCILPVLPIIISGRPEDSHYRPLYVVGGLSVTFVAMGILTALFGGLITAQMSHIEKVAGILITTLGVLMLFNINPFKFLSFLSNLHVNSSGHLEGLILGLTLGVIWIPCVGPFLSAILFQVAAHGRIGFGIVAMLFYSIGFSIPMLGVAYASHFTRNRTDFIKRHPKMVSAINGILLIAFGLYITFVGMIGFSSF